MKILMIQLGRIGDMILATPAFKLLKERFPDSELNVIAGRHNHLIISNNPYVDKIIVYEKEPLKLIKFIYKLKTSKYDCYFDPKDHKSNESKILGKMVRANLKFGYNVSNLDFKDTSIVEKHYIEKYIRHLKEIGVEIPKFIPKPVLFENSDSQNYVNEFLKNRKIAKYFVLNISASHERKMWQNENWSRFLKNIETQFEIILSYAPTESEKAKDLLKKNNRLIEFQSRSLFDTISLIKNSAMLITPDTALVHIAAAFDIPLLGLYSGLDDFYEKFAPLSSNQEIIRATKGDNGIHSIKAEELIEGFRQFSRKLKY